MKELRTLPYENVLVSGLSPPLGEASNQLDSSSVISRTPFRISFFGGGTDYPQWYLHEEEGAVLSTAINKYSYLRCESAQEFVNKWRSTDPAWLNLEFLHAMEAIPGEVAQQALAYLSLPSALNLQLFRKEDLPIRSGIGSSSSFIVGLLRALYGICGRSVSTEELAQNAIDFEQKVLWENVGSQDQVAAAYGGFNFIRFERSGKIVVEPLQMSASRITTLESKLMLFYTHSSRNASGVAGHIISNVPNRKHTLRALRKAVDDGRKILGGSHHIDLFGELLHENWMLKKELSDRITNSKLDAIYETALRQGAIGGKLLGAGAGGFMLFYVPEERQEAVRLALAPNTYVPFRFERTGSTLIYQPRDLRPLSS